ncbi:MAG: hypothetical protein NVS9B3_01420 [Gemmatimonadaceae bacterium]
MIIFHRFLIATAILFCAAFAIRSALAFHGAGHTLDVALAAGFGVAAAALAYYLKNLNRFLHR